FETRTHTLIRRAREKVGLEPNARPLLRHVRAGLPAQRPGDRGASPWWGPRARAPRSRLGGTRAQMAGRRAVADQAGVGGSAPLSAAAGGLRRADRRVPGPPRPGSGPARGRATA